MAGSTILFGLFLMLEILHIQGQTCNEIKYTTINDVRRSTKFKPTGRNLICDRNFIKDDQWYRFESAAGDMMPTENPGSNVCGTYIPIWFKGTHPTTDNVVMNATACAALPFVFPFGCGTSYDIKVIKCGSFYLYRLKDPKQCQFAYCAGNKLPDTNCSATGDKLPVCPGVIPRVTVGADAKHEESEDVRLRCFWESPGNLTNVEYEARWFGDSKDIQPKIQRSFTGLETPEFLFQPRLYKQKLNETIGYEFHKNVRCQVRARYKTGSWSTWATSKTIYTGMEVSPTFIPINDCGDKEREVIITLRPHLPIRGNPVKIDIQSPTTKLIDEICVVGDKKGFADCGLIFQSGHRVGLPKRFKLMTSCATGDKSDTLDGEYRLTHSFFDRFNNIFWVNHPFPVIKVSRRKFKKKQCRSTGDPHFLTFDGKYYDFFGRGTFLLYRNKFYGTEIQVRQRACNGGVPSCNCGVAIKENLFYKIYDMCYTHPGRRWWENNLRSRLRTQQLRDFKLNRFYSSTSQQGSSTKFEITLPSGVKIIVDRHNWGLNLYVWAPADPDNPSEGLCGNNNGNANDDFGQWNSPNQFGEHWRIRSHFTQFDYKGNKFEEEQLSDGCDQKICVCSRGVFKRCGREAERICFRDLGSQNARAHHTGSGIGECDNRPKRAVTPQDDSVDDQDDIPAFNPTVTSVNLTLSWPTKSGFTKENVTKFCENKLLHSKAGTACGQLNGVDVDGLVQECITDIQATEDFSWGASNFAALETSCIANIFNNISSFKNTSDGSIQLDTDVLTSLCPNDCSDHGNCTNSTCTCHEDFTAADCSVSLKDSPLVFDIRKSGLCDRRRRPCRNVGIFGYPLLDSEKLTCHVQEYKVIDSAWTPSDSIKLYPGQLVDLTEVKCSLPESPVNIGDYGNVGVTAAGLKIAVSNNRVNASNDSMLFITYDSVCQECNTTTGCQLRTDACIISGHCFAKNDSNPSDWCQQCLPELSTTSWNKRQNNKPPLWTTSSVFYAYLGKELRVQLRANDPENRTVYYSFGQKETFGASLSKNGSFRWVKNTKNSTMFIFNVTDECGTSSTLSVSVVIKECQCQNLGECFPDYRDLDGTGNFTCSCTDEYTGSLCELDVNECNMSNPCLNGSCNNQQPGFSCSCFPGYTGRLCQTEINECESNPCFLSVPCIDIIAGYRCGPCPRGYTGNGSNCTRNDGKVDECVKNPKVCHENAKCGYNNGSYECQCTQGYIEDGKDNCTDIDECLQSPCHSLANCINTNGSYECQCKQGYTGNGKVNCTDIDECQASPCHSLAKCLNTDGSYSCHCTEGLTGNGKTNCSDINECLKSPCHQDAKCTNSFSGYSCKCKQGYIGDGVNKCKENQPPKFLTPDKLHSVVKLYIQIEAEDPEGQNITFTLLRNGTITLRLAYITKDGFLRAHPNKNGTLFIQAEDEMGAKNILILHINITQCPCKNDGECYRNEKIIYPVKASDYLCRCKVQYTGNLCEKNASLCNEESCFPGLKCSPSQNQSEGYECEKCPPSFTGDGRHCELNITKGKSSVFKSTIKLTSEKWNDELKNKISKEYKILASRVIVAIRTIYERRTDFIYVIVKSFRQGSVIAEVELIFEDDVKDPFEQLQKAAESGKLGNMTFEIQDSDVNVDDDDSEDKILGLDKTIFIIIIVAVVVFIVIVILAICLRKRRHSRKGNVTLQKYHPTVVTSREDDPFLETRKGTEDEIDLAVLDSDTVCTKEEIKLKP